MTLGFQPFAEAIAIMKVMKNPVTEELKSSGGVGWWTEYEALQKRYMGRESGVEVQD